MRSAILAVAMALALGLVPMASAYHLSIGSDDAVGIGPVENAENPNTDDATFARGLGEDCTNYEDDGNPDEAAAVLAADQFCGQLVYEAGTSYEQVSTPDQDFPVPGLGLQFDAVFNGYVGNYGLSTCIPYCSLPGGEGTYYTLHDTLDEATGGDVITGDVRNERTGWQTYAVAMQYPHATLALDGVVADWDGAGWLFPVYDESIVAFLSESGGEPVDQERLNEIVDAERGQTIPNGAAAQVCAFTADASISINAPQATFCEVLFLYKSEAGNDATQPQFGPDSNTDCDSAAFICGTLTPAWYAQLVCSFVLSGCADGDIPGVSGDGAFHSTFEYDVWHFVVAPTQSACNGAQEPGFDLDVDGAAPYLAHDLDIYSPIDSAADGDGLGNEMTYARAIADGFVDIVNDAIPGVDTGPVFDAVNDATADTTTLVIKGGMMEPNAAGDTSRSVLNNGDGVARGADPCAEIIPGSEIQPDPQDPEAFHTVDPWRDYIDNTVQRDAVGDGINNFDVYNHGEAQDGNANRPGPQQYYTTGRVGIFADRNDDGDYDSVGSGTLFADIYTTGAYPMFWDMSLEYNATSEQHEVLGTCVSGFGEGSLQEDMDDAGYGQATGLIQAVYLKEPTYMYSWFSSNLYDYLDGDATYVFLSGAMRYIRDTPDHPSHGAVTDAIVDAIEAAGGDPEGTVVYPGDVDRSDAGFAFSDFGAQCGSSTGGFTSDWAFLHDCYANDCSGDTISTMYVFELANADGTIGGQNIPAFAPNDTPFSFGAQGDIVSWLDVDPFDNDPSRNSQPEPLPTPEE